MDTRSQIGDQIWVQTGDSIVNYLKGLRQRIENGEATEEEISIIQDVFRELI